MNKRWQWLKSVFSKPKTYLRYREYPLFAELDDYDLYLLNDRMHERKFKPAEMIFEAGYPLEAIYFIRTGEVELMGVNCTDKMKSLSHPQHLGMLDMYHGEGRTSTAIAKTPVVMDAISSTDLMDYIRARPRCGIKILGAACKDFSDFIFEKAQEN